MRVGKYFNNVIDSVTGSGKRKIKNLRLQNPDTLFIIASGCFDVVQPGHAIFTEQLRQIGNKLKNKLNKKNVCVVIALGRDETISQIKPGRPINPEMNRAYLMASLKEVDYVILDGKILEDGKIEFRNVLELLKPDVFILNTDDSAIKQKKNLCKRLNIKIVLVKREVPSFLRATSSTEIINKIKSPAGLRRSLAP